MSDDRESLIEVVISAFRPRDPRGRLSSHPGWHDLSPDDRELVFDETELQRRLEAAMDPDGLSSTAQAVLDRITGGDR
ncbi:MAG TPA: hypothetical protein ENK18_07790 [Deltaproteobacteria bacterium]|nr:hypothetical protein [Deltaproteobacteria bacterium]